MKKGLFALFSVAALTIGLASCGGNEPTKTNGTSGVAAGKTIKLEYSGALSDQEFNEGLFEEFKKERQAAGDPNTYEITYKGIGADKIDSQVQDWLVGPDVFEYASDKITALYQKGAVAKLGGVYKSNVENNNSALGVQLATFNGDIYGFPYTGDNTYYLQYDKSKLTEEEAKSVETILAKAQEQGLKFGYNLEEAFWSAGALFTFGADYSMSFNSDGAVQSVEATFDSEAGVKAAKAIYSIMTHPAWQNGMEAPTEANNLIGCIAGTWDIAAYKEALGENYACAPMPTVTVDGETKNLGAFLGGKLLGVNPQRSQGDEERLRAAYLLADYLTNEKSQLARFEHASITPCNKIAAANENVLANPNVAVLAKQAEFAHAQTAVPGNYWSAPADLTAGIKQGTITLETIADSMKSINDKIKASE